MAGSLKHENTYVSSWVLGPCLLGAVELRSICGPNILDDAEMMLTGVSRGHICNKDELSRRFGVKLESSFLNDVRSIMQLYKKLGYGFAKYINGLFLVALYDQEKDTVLVANDRYGFYPMFYFLGDKRFVFASEVKPILKEPTFAQRIDRSAVSEFFSFSQLIGDATFFEQIKWLGPATILVYDRLKDQVLMQQYWDFSVERYKEHRAADLDVLLKSYKKLMMKAVERAVQDKKEIGVFLSGGLDSRHVAAFASETDVDVVTFTFGARNCPQRGIAKRVAEELGLENVFYEISSDFISNFAAKIVYQGDGLIRIRDCHCITVLERISKIVDTVLMGTLGESLFGYNADALFQYIKKRANYNWKSLNSVKEYIFNHANRGLPLDMYSEAFAEDFHVQAKEMLLTNFEKEFNRILRNKRFNTALDLVNYWDYRVTEQRYIFQTFQFINWYVETRHPFLDNDLVDYFAFRLPIQLQLGERFLKKALNYCFPAMGKIPLESGARPEAGQIRVIMGQMKRFAHRKVKEILELASKGKLSIRPPDYRNYGQWLRTGSRDYALSLLLSSEALNRGFFKREFIEKLLFEHMTAKKDHDAIICDLINFELMNRMFFEKRSTDHVESVSSS
jgi:asparagine synthase (glutamine-hydrolysing)